MQFILAGSRARIETCIETTSFDSPHFSMCNWKDMCVFCIFVEIFHRVNLRLILLALLRFEINGIHMPVILPLFVTERRTGVERIFD